MTSLKFFHIRETFFLFASIVSSYFILPNQAFLSPLSSSCKRNERIGQINAFAQNEILHGGLLACKNMYRYRLFSSNVEENNVTSTEESTSIDNEEQSKPVFNLKGYTKVYDNVNNLQEGEQFPLVLQSTQDKSYLRDRFFILLKNQGKVHLIDPQCGRCNYPLINGEIVDEPGLNLSDNTSITCKLCGLRHSIIDGSVSKPKSGGTNVIQKIGGVFFNKGERSDILVHPVHVTESGEIYAKILPRKKITEVMPFQD